MRYAQQDKVKRIATATPSYGCRYKRVANEEARREGGINRAMIKARQSDRMAAAGLYLTDSTKLLRGA